MSAVAPKPTSVVTVAMPSSASPRPAASSGSRSGTTSALGSTCPPRRRFLASPRLSDAAASRLDGHRFPGFCPGYAKVLQPYVGDGGKIAADPGRNALQVRIDAVIAEVTLNDALQYGTQFFFKSGGINGILSSAQVSPVNPGAAPLGLTFPGFFLGGSGAGGAPFAIQALQQVTTVQVLSSPQLMVLDN